MYYILGFIAFLLLALGIFLMVSKSRKVTIGFICVALAICTFVAIPIIAVHSFLFSPAKNESKKEIVRLTLQDFSTAYAQSAPMFGAPAGFVLNIESGENTDTAKAKINDISTLSIVVEKNSNRKLRGVMITVGTSDDSLKMFEALKTTYAVVKIFEPEQTAEQIIEFVQKIFSTESGNSISGNNAIYTINQALGNTILTIHYPTE